MALRRSVEVDMFSGALTPRVVAVLIRDELASSYAVVSYEESNDLIMN